VLISPGTSLIKPSWGVVAAQGLPYFRGILKGLLLGGLPAPVARLPFVTGGSVFLSSDGPGGGAAFLFSTTTGFT
jgi:hypothetical protein